MFVSVALPATLYQPLPISDTAPLGLANAPPFFEIVTVGDSVVAPVMWSLDRTSKNTSGYAVLDCCTSYPVIEPLAIRRGHEVCAAREDWPGT